MGIFSFLTGKKDAPPDPADQIESWSTPAATATAVTTDAAHTPDPDPAHPSDTPFSPPPAWDIAALTAPPPETTGDKPALGPVDPEVTAMLQPKVVEKIKTVFDPEIPVDIYELGLIYEILADAERHVLVRMTLTSPACPSAQQIPSEVRYKVKAIPEVTDAWVEIAWEPPWDKERMSEAAKLQLGFL